MNKQELTNEFEKLARKGSGAGIEGFNKGLTFGLSLIDRLYEPEKPTIPQFIADWIEKKKEVLDHLFIAMNIEWLGMPNEVINWFESKEGSYEIFARAWLDGYKIEKVPQYYVRENNYLLCKYKNEVIDYVEAVEREITNLVKLKLTEQEIKDYDERYWAFAEEVEE